MLLRLVYLSVTNVFALLRLLPVSNRDKDVEILTLRHQVMILQRQLGKTRELLDRTLTWNQQHLLHALREFEHFSNRHRPHQGIANARPLRTLPPSVPAADISNRLHVRRRDRLGGILHEYQHAT